MIKFENTEVVGWEHAIRGMRNPMNSWEKSDSGRGGYYIRREYGEPCSWHRIDNPDEDDLNDDCVEWVDDESSYKIGLNDLKLMMNLRNAGTDHRKFMRMITVYVDIIAPLYWWKEFKTYRAGRKFGDPEPDIIDPELLEMDIETNSCSTMHKIHEKEFTLEDFSHEHLSCIDVGGRVGSPYQMLKNTIRMLNECRELYLQTKDKEYWWQMIQLLPTSYNQKRTVMLNYEVLANIYKSRRNHKLDEWVDFCKWIESLPYSELICGPEFLRKEFNVSR